MHRIHSPSSLISQFSVRFDLKSVRMEVDPVDSSILGLISQISRYLVLVIILNNFFQAATLGVRREKLSPSFFTVLSGDAGTRLGLGWQNGKVSKLGIFRVGLLSSLQPPGETPGLTPSTFK